MRWLRDAGIVAVERLVAIVCTGTVVAGLGPVHILRIGAALDAVGAFGGELSADGTRLGFVATHHGAWPRGVFQDSVAVGLVLLLHSCVRMGHPGGAFRTYA